MTDRYHRAARDGYLEVLKETTKKDCNSKDEDGMTPTLWAAFEGNLDALRLLVGRGGDPDKCDYYGNTAVHLAAAKGHLNCVTFLVNFGVNLYSLDIDHHTPQELAAMNDCTEILRYLDGILSKEEVENPKQVKKLKEKADKDSAKLLKDFAKHLEKAEKLAKVEKKELEKEIQTMTISEERDNFDTSRRMSTIGVPKFSDMVGSGSGSSAGGGSENGNFKFGTVFKKATSQRRKSQMSVEDHFKIRDKEVDGKMTVRKLNGLRRDSEIIFVAPKKIDVDESSEGLERFDGRAGGMTRLGGDTHLGIFDRPGLGSLAFRKSMTASLFSFGNTGAIPTDRAQDESIGSAGSLAHRSQDEEEEEEEQDDQDFGPEFMPVAIFLAALGMQEWIPVFGRERIDLKSLMLLDADDLREMNLPKGPIKTIMKAIEDRRKDIDEDSPIEDTQL